MWRYYLDWTYSSISNLWALESVVSSPWPSMHNKPLKVPEMGSKHWIDFLRMSFYILSYSNKRSGQRQRDTKQGSCMHSITLCILPVLLCSSGLMPSTLSYCLSVTRCLLLVGCVFSQIDGQKIIWLNLIQLDNGSHVRNVSFLFFFFLVIQLGCELKFV